MNVGFFGRNGLVVRKSILPTAIAIAVALIIAIPAIIVVLANEASLRALFRDVTAIVQVHPLTGMMSSFGIILWGAGAATCFFVTAVLTKRKDSVRPGPGFFLGSGGISLYLMLDDGFLLHEDLYGNYLNVGEGVALILLLIGLIAYALSNRKNFPRTPWPILFAAAGMLGFSVLFDGFITPLGLISPAAADVAEDLSKWIGICLWFAYFFATGVHRLAGEPEAIAAHQT